MTRKVTPSTVISSCRAGLIWSPLLSTRSAASRIQSVDLSPTLTPLNGAERSHAVDPRTAVSVSEYAPRVYVTDSPRTLWLAALAAADAAAMGLTIGIFQSEPGRQGGVWRPAPARVNQNQVSRASVFVMLSVTTIGMPSYSLGRGAGAPIGE